MTFSSRFRFLLKRVIFGLAVFHALAMWMLWLPLHWNRTDPDRDMAVYYRAAVRLAGGEPLYQPYESYAPTMLPDRFFYPPPFMILARPLVELGWEWFSRLWYLLVFAAFWIYAACLGKIVRGFWDWRATIVAALAVQLTPRATEAISSGNFEPVMWACYGLAVATPARAAPLAFAAMMKLHPIWALCAVMSSQKKRAIWPALLILLLGFGVGIALVGAENAKKWWGATSPVISQGNFSPFNVSFSFAPLRLAVFAGWDWGGGPFPMWVRVYLSAMSVGAPLLTFYLTRNMSLEWRIALLGAATVLFSPLCWAMYLPLLLLPAALFLRERKLPLAS